MKYRKDIQILRGISVLLVVLFHLDLGGFKSGFLGVDVFFVISGFLMAILYNHNDKRSFFKRRALRLLPAYFMVTLLTIMVSIFIVTPNEYIQVVKQSFFASSFSSNIGFWLQNSYFSKADFNPLLHLWSLGLEIQFYLIIPILFFFFSLYRYTLLIILVISLLLCFSILGISSKTSFFMMPLRVWEFLIGYAVALYFTNNGSIVQKRYTFLGTFGLIIILFIPFIEIDGLSKSFLNGHPGVYTLMITLATGLVLTFGISKKIEETKIGEGMVILGKYSYSIYLVHFPVIVLYLYEPFSGTKLKVDSYVDTFSILGIIIVLSFFMYHIIELGSKKVRKIYWLLYLSPLIIIGTAFVGIKIQEQIFTPKDRYITEAFSDRDTYRCGLSFRILNPRSFSCNLTNIEKEKIEKKIMLVGNSHSDSIKNSFLTEAKKLNTDVWFLVSNKPLMRSNVSAQKIIDDAIDKEIDMLVLHYSPNIVHYLSKVENLIVLAKQNNIDVSFIMPVPTWKRHIPLALWKNMHENKILPTQTLEEYQLKNKKLYDFLSKQALSFKHFKVYEIAPILCKNRCLYVNDIGQPLYFDTGHLTLTGSRYLSGIFREIILENIKNR